MLVHVTVVTWGWGACCEVCLDILYLDSPGIFCYLHKELVPRGGVRAVLSGDLWFHWFPVDYGILKDHCQPHAEFSFPSCRYPEHVAHCCKESLHWHPTPTPKTPSVWPEGLETQIPESQLRLTNLKKPTTPKICTCEWWLMDNWIKEIITHAVRECMALK